MIMVLHLTDKREWLVIAISSDTYRFLSTGIPIIEMRELYILL